MSLDEAQSMDLIQEVNGFHFIVEESLDRLYPLLTIDYRNTLFARGFIFEIQNESSSTCG